MTVRTVTAVTLSLNQGPYIERALLSVLEQDIPVEYIVVDAGSTDGSREVIDAYRGQLAKVIFESDEGPADGLNKALRYATGDAFVCVNADDLLIAGAVGAAIEAFKKAGDVAAIYANGRFIDGDGNVLRRFRSTPFDVRRFVLGGVNVMHQATFVRLDAWRAVGGFNSSNRTSWDAELLVDMALAGYQLKRVEGLWGTFTIHSESITGSGHLNDSYDLDRDRMFEKVMARQPRRSDGVRRLVARGAKWVGDPTYLLWRFEDIVRSAAL